MFSQISFIRSWLISPCSMSVAIWFSISVISSSLAISYLLLLMSVLTSSLVFLLLNVVKTWSLTFIPLCVCRYCLSLKSYCSAYSLDFEVADWVWVGVVLEGKLLVGGGCFVSLLYACECLVLVQVYQLNANLFLQFVFLVVLCVGRWLWSISGPSPLGVR